MNIQTIATRSVGLLFAGAWIGTVATAPLPASSHDDPGRLSANAFRDDIPVEISPGREADHHGSTIYRVHGTNAPETIGASVSSGCIRLTDDDVTDLYSRVTVGTRIVVLPGPVAIATVFPKRF